MDWKLETHKILHNLNFPFVIELRRLSIAIFYGKCDWLLFGKVLSPQFLIRAHGVLVSFNCNENA